MGAGRLGDVVLAYDDRLLWYSAFSHLLQHSHKNVSFVFSVKFGIIAIYLIAKECTLCSYKGT